MAAASIIVRVVAAAMLAAISVASFSRVAGYDIVNAGAPTSPAKICRLFVIF